MQRLSLSSTVIMTLVIFSTVVVVTTVVGIPIQANAKKKMMITTPISPSQSLDGNSVLMIRILPPPISVALSKELITIVLIMVMVITTSIIPLS